MRDYVIRLAPDASLGASSDYAVSVDPSRSVLDALESIAPGQGARPLYRHSCHHGSCGSCGAMIRGKPALMCLSRLRDLEEGSPRDGQGRIVIILSPLSRMTVIGDLAVFPGPVFRDIPDGAGYLRLQDGSGRPRLDDPTEPAGAGTRTAAARFEECIECGICMAACPVEAPFMGPAALAALDREREKRPETIAAALDRAGRQDGVAACERRFECSRACPQGVAPGRHIAALRKLASGAREPGPPHSLNSRSS